MDQESRGRCPTKRSPGPPLSEERSPRAPVPRPPRTQTAPGPKSPGVGGTRGRGSGASESHAQDPRTPGGPGRIWVTDQPETPAARPRGLPETEEDGGRQRRVRDGLLLVGAQLGAALGRRTLGGRRTGPRPPLRLWPRGPRARRGRRRRRRARGWRAQGHADLVGRLHALGHGSGWQHLQGTGGDQVPGTTPSPASGEAGSAETATAAGMSLSFLIRDKCAPRPLPPARAGRPLPHRRGGGRRPRGSPAGRLKLKRVPASSGARVLAASHLAPAAGGVPAGIARAVRSPRTRRGDWPRLEPRRPRPAPPARAPGPPAPAPAPAPAGPAATAAAAGSRGLREADGRGAPGAGGADRAAGRRGGERSRIPSALRAGNFGVSGGRGGGGARRRGRGRAGAPGGRSRPGARAPPLLLRGGRPAPAGKAEQGPPAPPIAPLPSRSGRGAPGGARVEAWRGRGGGAGVFPAPNCGGGRSRGGGPSLPAGARTQPFGAAGGGRRRGGAAGVGGARRPGRRRARPSPSACVSWV